MKKILFLLLLSTPILHVCNNEISAAEQQPQIEQVNNVLQPSRFSRFASSIFSKAGHALRSTASWTFKDTYSTPNLITEIAPYRKDISDVLEVLSLLRELKKTISEDKDVNEFIINAIIKEEEPNKEQTKRRITEVLNRNINKANETVFYFLKHTHKLSEDARILGEKLLPLQSDEKTEEESIILTQEFLQTKISLLESYQQERLVQIGEITLKYKNLPILKPIATFIANKFIFVPLKISLLIAGTALLIQIGALGTSYVIPSLREIFPSLSRFDYCLTPLYKIGSFFQQSIGSLFSWTATPCQASPYEATEITKIVEKPLELYKQCSDFVHTNSINLQNYLTEEQKIECIKRCIFEKANEDTLKLLQIFAIQK